MTNTDMTAAKKHDARYADFAARMLAALAKEESDIARFNVTMYRSESTDVNAATVRPSR